MRRSSKALGTLAAATSLALVGSGLALADTLDITQADVTVEPGGSTTFTIGLQATSEDGDVNGCNAGGSGNDVTVSFSSSDTAKVPNPTNATITACDEPATAAIEGGATVTVSAESAAASGSDVTITATASGGKTVVKTSKGVTTTTNSLYTTDTVLVKVRASDPCASVSNPAAPVFSAADAGTSGWHTSVPLATASSTTSGVTISYATDGETFGALPTLGEGITTVKAKASQPAPCEGKSSTAPREFKVDTVAPAVSPASVNNTTWRNTPLSQDFAASDSAPGSGLAVAADATFNLTASADSVKNIDGTFTPTGGGSKTVSDVAGNQTTRTLSALIDTVDPVAAVTGGPQNGQTYFTGNVPVAPSPTCSDDLSGLAATGGCVVGTGYSQAVGSHSFTVTAKDKAGNEDSDSIAYTVKERTSAGYTSPVRLGADVVNRVKGGSTVPLKFEVFESDGTASVELTDAAILKFSIAKYTCDTSDPGTAVEEFTAGSTTLRYDATGGQFIQNWKTPTTLGCYRANIAVTNGPTLTAQFQVTK